MGSGYKKWDVFSLKFNCFNCCKLHPTINKRLYLAVAWKNRITAEILFLHNTRSCEVHCSSVIFVLGQYYVQEKFWQWYDQCWELVSLRHEFQRDCFRLARVWPSGLNAYFCLECVSWAPGVLLWVSSKRHPDCVLQDSSVIWAEVQ